MRHAGKRASAKTRDAARYRCWMSKNGFGKPRRLLARAWAEWSTIHIEEVLGWTDEAELANNQQRFKQGYLHALQTQEDRVPPLGFGLILGFFLGLGYAALGRLLLPF